MAWAFPREKFSSGYVLDCDDFNANVSAWAQETDGNLNEHNFIAGTTLTNSMDQASDGIAMKVLHRKNEVSPTGSGGTLGYDVPHSVNWAPIEDTDVEFNTVGESLFIIYSFQLNNPGGSFASGLVFCIEVDGAPQMNSLLGTGDESNDFVNANDDAGQEYNFDSGASARSSASGFMVKCSCRVSPGHHTVRLLARNLHMINGTVSQTISQRETIIMKLWC